MFVSCWNRGQAAFTIQPGERIAQMVHDSAGAIIDRFYYCPFHPEGTVAEYSKEHPWRKPQPGMLLEAARSLDLDLKECWMVGDGERDIEAGRAAGCQTILITRKTSVNTKADFQAGSLAEAAAIIAQNRVRPRHIIPPAPTVVVSPKVAHEARHAEALTGRAGAAIAADHGPDAAGCAQDPGREPGRHLPAVRGDPDGDRHADLRLGAGSAGSPHPFRRDVGEVT